MENTNTGATGATSYQRVYICSPYRGKTGEEWEVSANVEAARDYCRKIATKYPATIPVAPHIYLTQFLEDSNPEQREAGLAIGRAILATCQAVLVFGEAISEGMRLEIMEAARLGIPVLNGYAAVLGQGSLRMSRYFWEKEVGIPTPPTICRTTRLIDPDAFERYMMFTYPKEPGNQNADIDDDSLRATLDAARTFARAEGVAVGNVEDALTPKPKSERGPDPVKIIREAIEKGPRRLGRELALAAANTRSALRRFRKEAADGKK